jgi:oxygen-independent coproporphyrinogen-3 oxidase
MGLRIEAGVAFDELSALGLGAADSRVTDLVSLGLIAPDPLRLRATREGRLLLDRVTASLIV